MNWLLTCLAVGWIGAGCSFPGIRITGSGHLVTKEYALTGFSRLAVGSAFQVEITQGPSHRVTVTVDDNLVEYLDVDVAGDTLRLKMQPNLSLNRVTLKASVSLPELAGLDLSGAVNASANGFSSDKPFDAELSGASRLQGEIKNGEARFSLSGASHLEIRGQAGMMKITASGASHANLADYRSGNTVVQASGASHLTVHATGTLDAEASGASSVAYVGEPSEVKSSASGASSVRRK